MPFQGLERLQKSLGIPLSAATQWDVVEQAPAGKAERTGVFTTGVLSKVGVWMIAL